MNLVISPEFFTVITTLTFINFIAKTLSIIHGSESQQSTSSKPVVSTVTSTATKTTKSINIISSFTIPPTTSEATTEQQKVVEKKPVETPPTKLKGKAKVSYLTYLTCDFN